MMFRVEWIPERTVVARAIVRGMPEGGSPLDYCDPEDAVLNVHVADFTSAIKAAKTKLADDYFGQVRIERLLRIVSRTCPDRWDANAVWHVSDRDERLDEDAPEYCLGVQLYGDEEFA
jgi:hypothetical protein